MNLKSNTKKAIYIINLFCLAYIVFWVVSPVVIGRDFYKLIVIITTGLWVLTSIYLSKHILFKGRVHVVLAYLAIIYVAVASFIGGGWSEFSRQTFLIIFLFFLLIYNYSKQKQKNNRWIFIFSLVLLGVFSLITFIHHFSFPIISRAITGNGNLDRSYYQGIGVGGFNLIYTVVLACPVVLYYLINNNWTYPLLRAKNNNNNTIGVKEKKSIMYQIAVILLIIILYALLIIAKFSLGLIAVLVATVIIIFNKRPKFIIIAFSAFVGLFMIVVLLIYNDIVAVPSVFSSYLNKINDIATSITSGQAQGSVGLRLSLYKESLSMISKYPLFGTVFNPLESSGGHSFLLDVLATFGLIPGGLIIYLTTYVPLSNIYTKKAGYSGLALATSFVLIFTNILNNLAQGIGVSLLIIFAYVLRNDNTKKDIETKYN
jgi:hypothetical protein